MVPTGLAAFPLFVGCWVTGRLLCNTWYEQWYEGLDAWERLFVALLAGVVLESWLLLFLAELGLFSMPAIALSTLAGWLLLYRVGKRPLRELLLPPPRLSLSTVVPLLVLVLAALLFSHPAQSFLVLDDSGIYALGGIHLAETGSLFARDATLASMSPEAAQELLFSGPPSASWRRLWGQHFIWNWDRSWVSFGLLHMQRLWCGLFTLFLGQHGGLWVAPAFGLLSTLGLFVLGRRWFSRAAGALAALLLTLNFVQVRYARYPVSEMLTQAMVIGGFYLLALGREKRHVGLSILAGLCLGGLFLIRIDALFIGLVSCVLVVYWRWSGQWRREQVGFALALVGALAYSAMHNLGWAWAYLNFLWQTAGSPALAMIVLVGTLGLAFLVLFGELRRTKALTLSRWLSQHVWHLLATATAAVAAMVTLGQVLSTSGWRSLGILWLSQYWTPFGLFLAALGLARSSDQRSARLALPLLIACLGYLAVFSLNPMVNPVQPWAMRRFVPVIMPVLALLTAQGIVSLPPVRFRLHLAVAGFAALALAIAFLRVDFPFLRYTEYEGTAQQLGDLAQRFEPESLVLFDNASPGLHVSQALAYMHHRNVFVLQRTSPDTTLLTPFLQEWHHRGAPIYLVLSGSALDWHPPEWTFLPLDTFSLHITRVRRTLSGPPDGIETTTHVMDIYAVTPGQPQSSDPHTSIRVLEMESGEYAYLRGGFLSPESGADGLTFRWTAGMAQLAVPVRPDEALTLRLRVAGGRPSGVEEAWLTIAVDGKPALREYMPAGFSFRILEIPLPRDRTDDESGQATIELQSNTWIPAAYGLGADQRSLGVAVDWVQWIPAGSGP